MKRKQQWNYNSQTLRQCLTSIIIRAQYQRLTMLYDGDRIENDLCTILGVAVKIPLCSLPLKKTNQNASRRDEFTEKNSLKSDLIYKRNNHL